VRPLDRWLPEYDIDELHERHVAAPPERAFAAALELPVAPDRVVAALFRLRGLGRRGTIGSLAVPGALELERTETSLVAGLVGRPWRPRGDAPSPPADADAWRAYAEPGTVRMALAFWAEPHGEGARLSTETRVAATDATARRAFRLYWLVVGPFSALIRRRWLTAAARSTGATRRRGVQPRR
jgi:hypothetical protein